MLDAAVLVVLFLLALLAVPNLLQDRSAVRAVGVFLGLLFSGLVIWRGIRDDTWWMVPIGVAIAAVWIAIDERRSRRSRVD
jgi:hypothetical protein